MSASSNNANQVKPSDKFIYVSLSVGAAVGALIQIAVLAFTDLYREAAMDIARAQAVLTGAAILLVIVLGMLTYLEPTRSVRWLGMLNRRSEEAADSVDKIRSSLPRKALDFFAIAGVGYYAGASLSRLLAEWPWNAMENVPQPESWLAPAGFATAFLLMLSVSLLLDKRKP